MSTSGMNPANRLLEGPILRSLLTLAIPIVAANTLQSAYQIIDAFWVGRLGGAAVAAVSATAPVMFLMFALGAGLSIAGSTLIAQFVGAGNYKMVGHIAGQTLTDGDRDRAGAGRRGLHRGPCPAACDGRRARGLRRRAGLHARARSWACVFNFAFFVFQGIMRSIGRPTLPVYIVLGTVCLNFVLDPLLIFGWGPVPGYGVMGAALVTLATQAIAAVIGIAVLRAGMHGIHVHLADFIPDRRHIRRAFFLGLPASLDMSARALGFMVMTFLVASFGTTTLAAYGVGATILQVVLIPAMGLSMAVAALAGQNIGAGNIDRAASIGRLGAGLGFGVLSAFGLLVFLFSTRFVAFFVPRRCVGDRGRRQISCASAALSWGCIGAQFALTGVFRASGNMVTNMMLTIVSLWVLQFPVAYVLSRHTTLGADGVYWSLPVSNVAITLITVCIYMHGGWRKKRLLDSEEVLTDEVTEKILSGESGI